MQQLSPSFRKNIEAGSIVSIPAIHFRLEDEIEKAMVKDESIMRQSFHKEPLFLGSIGNVQRKA